MERLEDNIEAQALLTPQQREGGVSIADYIADDDPNDPFLWHCQKMRSQVCYRINMYRLAARHCTEKDEYSYNQPILLATGLTSMLAFLGATSTDFTQRAYITLASGGLAMVSSLLTCYKNAHKFHVKAALFETAQRKYMALGEDLFEEKEEYRQRSIGDRNSQETLDNMLKKFELKYASILNIQAEMKYFPPNERVKQWLKKSKLTDRPPPTKTVVQDDGSEMRVENYEFKKPSAPPNCLSKMLGCGGSGDDGGTGDDTTDSAEGGGEGGDGSDFPCWKKAFGMSPPGAPGASGPQGSSMDGPRSGGPDGPGGPGGPGSPGLFGGLFGNLEKKKLEMEKFAEKKRMEAEARKLEIEKMIELKKIELEKYAQMEIEKARLEAELKKGNLSADMNAKLQKQQLELDAKMKAKKMELDGMETPGAPGMPGFGWGGGGGGGGGDAAAMAKEKAESFALETKAPRTHHDCVDGAKTLLRQVYMRQNCFMNLGQYCDVKDRNSFVLPISVLTGIAAFFGFTAGSPLFKETGQHISMVSGVLGFIGLILANIQQQQGYGGKAEVFRSSALQYRLIATEIEQNIRQHMSLNPLQRKSKKKKDEFLKKFDAIEVQIQRLEKAAADPDRFKPDLQKVIEGWLNEKGKDIASQEKSRLWPNATDQPERCKKSLPKPFKRRALYLTSKVDVKAAQKEMDNLVKRDKKLENAASDDEVSTSDSSSSSSSSSSSTTNASTGLFGRRKH